MPFIFLYSVYFSFIKVMCFHGGQQEVFIEAARLLSLSFLLVFILFNLICLIRLSRSARCSANVP